MKKKPLLRPVVRLLAISSSRNEIRLVEDVMAYQAKLREADDIRLGVSAAIDALKQRATKIGKAPKKSELLRAGLMLMTQLSDEALNKALAAVPPIKTGRPKA